VVEPSHVSGLPQFAQRNKFEACGLLPVARFPVAMAGMVPGGLGGAPALDNARA
jgi:CoA:oxalate CoA-transferase